MICPALPQHVNLPAMLLHSSGNYVSQYSFQVFSSGKNISHESWEAFSFFGIRSSLKPDQFLRRHVQSLSGKRLSTHQGSLSALPASQTMMAAMKNY